MRIIAGAIRNPVAIGATVLLISLFGLLSLKQLPLQLFPDIERPTISIFTNWRGASPEEVEAELLEPQEQVLQGLPGPAGRHEKDEPVKVLVPGCGRGGVMEYWSVGVLGPGILEY